MKRWYLYLIAVPLGLALFAYLIFRVSFPSSFGDILSRDNQAKNTQRDVEKMPEVKTVPKEVLELRQAHQLRPLTEREDGTKIQDLPNGIYGFSTCSVVALHATRGNTYSLEIHKHDRIVYYVGYASDEHIEKYLTRQKKLSYTHVPSLSGRGFNTPRNPRRVCIEMRGASA